MTAYPTTLPLDAINTIITDIKSGAVLTDRVEFAKSVWELQGYGLMYGLGEPTPAGVAQSIAPLTDHEVVAYLEQLKTPQFAFASAPPGAVGGVLIPAALALIPWKSILKWALTTLANTL